jgi:hypothetical protein
MVDGGFDVGDVDSGHGVFAARRAIIALESQWRGTQLQQA